MAKRDELGIKQIAFGIIHVTMHPAEIGDGAFSSANMRNNVIQLRILFIEPSA